MEIKMKFGPFKWFKQKPSTMKYGYYYHTKMVLPWDKKPRSVRVWLPEDYDFDNPDNRFPVIYFADGQNLVDRYLSAYGDWELDKMMHLRTRKGKRSAILVGIDCPKDPNDRANELNPPYVPHSKHVDFRKAHPFANQYVDYIANELKPLIDKLFFTLPDKDNTAIGGSSMGGIMAFYAGNYRSDIFGFALCFSPAFFLYTKKEWSEVLETIDVKYHQDVKFFLYVGGLEFEELFVKPTLDTYDYMMKNGFNVDNLALLYDSRERHHEKAWAKYAGEAFSFWLG